MKNKHPKLHKILVAIVSILVTITIGYLITWADNLNPTSPPTNPTSKTLDDIYYELDKDASATSSWGLDSSASPTSTMYTLQQIYDKTPDFHNDPGNASTSDVCDSTTFYIDDITLHTGTRAACLANTKTWQKEGSGSWQGINENLDWAKQMGITGWWSTTEIYSYCAAAECTGTGATTSIPYTYGTPGGWNGSDDYTNFNNSALQNYEVITADSTNLGDCMANTGDLVFPDGSVWEKDATNAYSTKLAGCDTNDSNAAAIWSAAGGTGSQYAYARNAPSALSMADAWDGKKDLTSGANGTHSYTNDYTNNDYYDRPSQSWYANGGTSRLPMIEEYEVARQGSWETDETSLLNGTSDLTSYHWSTEQFPTSVSRARRFFPSSGYADDSNVLNQLNRLWVVVAQ